MSAVAPMRRRWSFCLLALVAVSMGRGVRAGDDDDDGGSVCDKACVVGQLPALTSDTYHHSLAKLPTYEEACPTKVMATQMGCQDGFGGEMFARIIVRAKALSGAGAYVHMPFSVLDHVQGKEDEMERFMNFGADEIEMRSINASFAVQQSKDPTAFGPGCGMIHGCKSCGKCIRTGSGDQIARTIHPARARYRLGSHKPALPFLPGHYNVAVHHRRGDGMERAVSEATLLAAVASVNATLIKDNDNQGKPIHVYIFTQGSSFEVPEGVTLVADPTTDQHSPNQEDTSEKLRVAYHSMVMADAFIATKSSLGYSAGMLSYGRVFAFPFDRPALPTWSLLDSGGGVSEAEAAKSRCANRVAVEGRPETDCSPPAAVLTTSMAAEGYTPPPDTDSPTTAPLSIPPPNAPPPNTPPPDRPPPSKPPLNTPTPTSSTPMFAPASVSPPATAAQPVVSGDGGSMLEALSSLNATALAAAVANSNASAMVDAELHSLQEGIEHMKTELDADRMLGQLAVGLVGFVAAFACWVYFTGNNPLSLRRPPAADLESAAPPQIQERQQLLRQAASRSD